MRVTEIMTANPINTAPETSVVDAARLMRDKEVGALIVVEGDKPVGIITDRDITVRAVAEGGDIGIMKVAAVMSRDPDTIATDADDDVVLQAIRTSQVRRLIVVDHQDRVIGIISLADLVQRLDDRQTILEIANAVTNPSHA